MAKRKKTTVSLWLASMVAAFFSPKAANKKRKKPVPLVARGSLLFLFGRGLELLGGEAPHGADVGDGVRGGGVGLAVGAVDGPRHLTAADGREWGRGVGGGRGMRGGVPGWGGKGGKEGKGGRSGHGASPKGRIHGTGTGVGSAWFSCAARGSSWFPLVPLGFP